MKGTRGQIVVSVAIIMLLIESSRTSLLYTNLHYSSRWLKHQQNRWNVLVRWYPWFHLVGWDLFAPRTGCPGNETMLLTQAQQTTVTVRQALHVAHVQAVFGVRGLVAREPPPQLLLLPEAVKT
uniref:Uncharacterized protein n=1 Tax=Anopheles culicifacies TaxID=139723 RepID=A0A182LWG0_9DIPT